MSNRIDVLATHSRFSDHIRPVWEALPAERRGRWLTEMAHADLAADLDRPILCSSALECHYARQAGRRVIYIEHSVGQAYSGRFLGWAEHFEAPDLFLAPGPYAAEIAAGMWPRCPVVQVGVCKLDAEHRYRLALADEWKRWDAVPPGGVDPRDQINRAMDPRKRVALSFRFTGDLPTDTIPECGGAFEHFADAVVTLAASGVYKILGHGHPRAMEMLRPFYGECGIEIVETFEEVLARADLFVAGNTSCLYEFASTGRPVVCLQIPAYANAPRHGLRFGDTLPGLWVTPREDLGEAVAEALGGAKTNAAEKAKQWDGCRREAVARAYVACDGKATERAVGALVAYLDADPTPNP